MQSVSRLMRPDPLPGSYSGHCSLCGLTGDGQFLRDDILEKTTANLTALFDLNRSTMCAHCVAVWREPKKWHRGVYATADGVQFPVISRESATEDRPVWSDVLRAITDLSRVLILTTDPKKRVWPLARASSGQTACIYVHDPSRGISGNYWVNIPALTRALGIIETAYTAGFSKEAIQCSLFQSKTSQTYGLIATRALESEIAALRSSAEFIPALIAAQKEATK